MKNIKLCVLVLSLIAVSVVAKDMVITRSMFSNCYNSTCNKLSHHKGKVGIAVGAIGLTVVNKVFSHEIDAYVKPLIRSVWKKACNFFRRVFKREEKV